MELPLGDLVSFASGNTPSKSNPEYWGGETPWISANSIHSPFLNDSELRLTKIAVLDKAKLCAVGDILLLVRGSGLHSRLPVGVAEIPLAFNQDVKAIRSVDNRLDQQYLFYWFRGNQEFLLESVEYTGIGAGKLDTDFLKKITLNLPCLSEQHSIAHIGRCLDRKIELNQKMNQTLEDIAKAIFKSWFVDFDPVRAKMEGRPTGLPPEIDELFPDELVDSEIGEIPKGWELDLLGKHTELTKGRSYKSAELMESETALVTLKSFNRGGGYRLDGLKPYVGTFKPEQVVVESDLIIALTDVTQAADVIGKPAIVRSSSKHSKLVASLDVGIVRMNEVSLLTKEFCYFLMLSERYTQHSLGYTSGTTVLHLAKNASEMFEVSIPPTSLVDQFSEIASNLLKRIFVAEKETETLSELRDTLLPKLISGELRIPDADKFLEEAGI